MASESTRPLPSPTMVNCMQDFNSSHFYRALFAEFLATLVLVFVGCGACIDWDVEAIKMATPLYLPPVYLYSNSSSTATHVVSSSIILHSLYDRDDPMMMQVALAFGLSVTIIVWCIGHVSGGHINPAVTVAMLVTRKISLLRALLYILMQCVGAIAGTGLLLIVTPKTKWGDLGSTMVNPEVSESQAFAIELVITFVLVLTVFACCDPLRQDSSSVHPFIIGLSVVVCHVFAVRYTGSSMNPARSLGPMVLTQNAQGHWVYWMGPIVGGTLAGMIYDNVFAKEHSESTANSKTFLPRDETGSAILQHDKGQSAFLPHDETEPAFPQHDNADTTDRESSI